MREKPILVSAESELERLKRELEETQIALRKVIAQFDDEKNNIQENINMNVEKNVLPIVRDLRATPGISQIKIAMLENSLKNLCTDFYRRMIIVNAHLTPTEVEVCRLVKSGYMGKHIAEALTISYETVRSHKKNIRKKLGLESDVSLKQFLEENF